MITTLSEFRFCFVFIGMLHLAYTQSYGDLRLMQKNETDSSFTEGRLEIYINGEWGTICEDSFDYVDATVACHQLGYDGSIADPVAGFHSRYGKGSDGPIWLDDVECTDPNGLHILSCPSSGVGVHNCDHFSDIAVICNPTPLSASSRNSLRLRLQGGRYPSQGRVEVYCIEEWGTVCNQDIQKEEANIICRQLGYTEASSYESTNETLQSEATQPIWFNSLDCKTEEESFEDCGSCPLSDIRSQSAQICSSHMYDLTIQCNHSIRYGSIRFAQGNLSSIEYSEGRVELYLNGDWRTVCPDNFADNDADIICQQLDYLRAKELTKSSMLGYGQGTGEMWFKHTDCILEQDNMFSCLMNDTQNSCSQTDPAAVVCTNEPAPTYPPTNATNPNFGLMLPFSLEVLIAICVAGVALLCFCCLFMIVCCTHLCCDYHVANKKQRPLLDTQSNAFTFTDDIDPKLDAEYLEMKRNANRAFSTDQNPPQLIPYETPQIPGRTIRRSSLDVDHLQTPVSPYPFPQEIERIKLRCSQDNLFKMSSNQDLPSNLQQIANQLQPPDEFSTQDSVQIMLQPETEVDGEGRELEPAQEEERRSYDEAFREVEEECQALSMSFGDGNSEHSQ